MVLPPHLQSHSKQEQDRIDWNILAVVLPAEHCFCPQLTFCWVASIQHFKTWHIFFAQGRLYMACFSPQLTLQFLCSWRIFLQIYSNHVGIYFLIEEKHGVSLLRSRCEVLNLFLKCRERFCVQGLCLVCHGANRSHIVMLLVSIGMPSSQGTKVFHHLYFVPPSEQIIKKKKKMQKAKYMLLLHEQNTIDKIVTI